MGFNDIKLNLVHTVQNIDISLQILLSQCELFLLFMEPVSGKISALFGILIIHEIFIQFIRYNQLNVNVAIV